MVLGTTCVAAAYGSALLPGDTPVWAPWLMVMGIACLVSGFMYLGLSRPGRRLGKLVWPLVFVFLVLVVVLGLALALPKETPGAPLLGGLPLRAALIIYGIGLLPAVVLPVVYALTFRTATLDEADIERIRAAARAAAASPAAPP